mgnify:CR=1 FL=1
MDVRQVIGQATASALVHYGDNATVQFYEFLKRREFKTTRCEKCEKKFFPPRSFCPYCFCKDIEWIDLPREGILWSFTTQERALRFSKPDVIGFVQINGIGKILSKIDGDINNLKIGMKVRLDFVEIEGGAGSGSGLVLHKFVAE